ncbi:MAG: sulfatase-like hydrolase/transferase [Gammaproteobacteria bacterium]|nr:sulfatase-like hydrolase/transferase [Gammaproteobacteria bacterium]
MNPSPNILFIMCDQLRQDYLSCYGHRSLATPHIDGLARRGVRFENAFCQAPLCAPSRASFYTGRYQSSHGVMGNEDATQLGEKMLADYLRPLGYRTAVVGKTHSRKRRADMRDAGIRLDSKYARAAASGGFEPYEWHEGLYPDPVLPENQGYTRYLKSVGYDDANPWDSRANSGVDEKGRLHSGWALRSSAFPAAVPEPHSETAFTTRRAMDFIREAGDRPWCLHLSYIKPHWPVIAPAPYCGMFGTEDIQEVVRSDAERAAPHPVVEAFMQLEYSESYSRKEVRDTVIPAYMGLVKQVDDHIGRLMAFLDTRGLLGNTLIVFTSDHGDYLGDHWLGEKDLFHEPSVKLPMIVVDPGREADSTRNSVRRELVESVDIVPTFVEFAGGAVCRERVEGRSLLPLLRSPAPPRSWREVAISEIDYSERGARSILGIGPDRCRATMARDHCWKFIYYQGFPPQLFDLKTDPDELVDLGRDPRLEPVRQRMKEAIFQWQYSLKRRVGLEYGVLEGQGPQRDEEYGIIIGRW